VTVSLDGLDDAVFRRMNDVDFPVADVLAGIEAAHAAGLSHIKVNMVVKRGTNDHEILPMARHFRGTGTTLRFIEYMDVGATNGWRMDEVLPSAELIERLRAELPLVPLEPSSPGETAERWGYADAQRPARPSPGRSGRDQQRDPGFLPRLQPRPPVHRGQAVPVPVCLQGLRPAQRCCAAAPATDIASAIAPIWQQRTDRYSELRSSLPADNTQGARRVEMSYIGG
jgi:cyclic pyranopterin phosphate synthase